MKDSARNRGGLSVPPLLLPFDALDIVFAPGAVELIATAKREIARVRRELGVTP